MPQLYTPPQWKNVGIFQGSLRYGVQTSYCVYQKAGQWVSTQSPAVDELNGATYVFPTPVVVSDALATSLATFGVGTLSAVPAYAASWPVTN
jgi:hypothetical protein